MKKVLTIALFALLFTPTVLALLHYVMGAEIIPLQIATTSLTGIFAGWFSYRNKKRGSREQ